MITYGLHFEISEKYADNLLAYCKKVDKQPQEVLTELLEGLNSDVEKTNTDKIAMSLDDLAKLDDDIEFGL